MRVMTLRDYEGKLPFDAKRPHVLQRYFPSLGLSLPECGTIDRLAVDINENLKRNHEQALTFIRQARGNTPRQGPKEMPADHKARIAVYNGIREAHLAQFKSRLRASLGANAFEKLDLSLNADVISKVQLLTPKLSDHPVPPGRETQK